MSPILRYLCLITDQAQMNKKVPTLHKSRYLKDTPTDFSVKLQAVRVRILFDIHARFRHKKQKPMLDKKAESWSSFSRCSFSPDKSFILFVPVYFTAIRVL